MTQGFGSGGSSDVDIAQQVTPYLQNDSTFRYYSLTFTVPSISGKTIGAGSFFQISFGQGTNNSASAWTLDISNIQVEVGSVATPFEHRSFGEELARCQRYCCAAVADGSIDNYAPLANGRYYNSTYAQFYISFPTTMRYPPTLDSATTAAGTFFYNIDGGFGGAEATSITLNERAYNGATVSVNGATGQTAGTATTLYCHDTEVAKLIFTAEL